MLKFVLLCSIFCVRLEYIVINTTTTLFANGSNTTNEFILSPEFNQSSTTALFGTGSTANESILSTEFNRFSSSTPVRVQSPPNAVNPATKPEEYRNLFTTLITVAFCVVGLFFLLIGIVILFRRKSNA